MREDVERPLCTNCGEPWGRHYVGGNRCPDWTTYSDKPRTPPEPSPAVTGDVGEIVGKLNILIVQMEALRGYVARLNAEELGSLLSDVRALLTSLAERNTRLEEALRVIADRPGCGEGYAKGVGSWPIDEGEHCAQIARAALSPPTSEGGA